MDPLRQSATTTSRRRDVLEALPHLPARATLPGVPWESVSRRAEKEVRGEMWGRPWRTREGGLATAPSRRRGRREDEEEEKDDDEDDEDEDEYEDEEQEQGEEEKDQRKPRIH